MATYPKLLKLDLETENALIAYLDEELLRCFMEKASWISDLEAWQKDYWAKPSMERRTFPFSGASNIVVPLTPIAVEATHARMETQLAAIDPFVAVTMRVGGKNNPLADLAEGSRDFEEYMDWELGDNIKMLSNLESSRLELIKFGTGISKQGYEKIVKKAVKYIGEERIEFDVVQKDGACVDSVPVARFIMPYVCQDPQTAPWCGEEHSMTPFEVKLREYSGLFYEGTYEKLLPWLVAVNNAAGQEAASGQQFTFTQENLENKTPVLPRRLDFFEIWCGFDVDGDGIEEEIMLYYHRMSRKLLGARYNWNEDLRRPYRHGVYLPVEHRFYGLGICKQNEQFQREITTIHRQRLDNATLANMRMFKVSKLSGYGPKEPIFPGKMWFLDDMDMVDTIQMGEIYPSAYNNEQGALIYSQQRTGINEVSLGMPQQGTPGTATSDLARIQEGNKKFDYVMMNIKKWLTDVIKDTVLNIKQFSARNIVYFQMVENGDRVQKLLDLPISLLKDGIIFEIGTATSQKNSLVDRQTWQQVAQMLQMYFQGMVEFAMAAKNPELYQLVVTKGMTAITEAMSQILDTFNIRNKDRILITEVLGMMQNARNINANSGPWQLPVGNGNTGTPSSSSAPGMDFIQKALGAVNVGSPNQAGIS